MDRRLIAGVLGLLLAGCAMGRSAMPEGAKATPVEMGTVDALPPAGDALAKTYALRDAATRRAAREPDAPPAAEAEAPMPPIPPGRRAPFAGQTSGSPRAQAPPPPGRGDEGTAPRPAPFADQVPGGPRPQLPGPGPVGPESPATPTASAPEPSPGPPPSPFVATTPVPPPAAPTDTEVRPTSATTPPIPPGTKGVLSAVNGKAATVGNEVITVRQVYAALIEKRDKLGDPSQWSNPKFKEKAFSVTLNGLIDRTLLVQAAKKRIKDLKQFYDQVDKEWMDRELPPLLREYKVDNIHELKRKLAGMGRSLDQVREDFRQATLAREFLQMQLKGKLHISFPEMFDYYNQHKDQFDRPAQVVWREIEVDIAKCPSRAEAKARAEAVLGRVRGGDDFARLAKAASHGPTAKDGGKWETAPGGSANPDINAALAALAPGQTSAVIEAPGGFHIVRLESRRDAGIAPFPDVQDQIRETIFMEKANKYSDEIIDSLRSKTIVTTIFDNPDHDPKAIRTGTGPNEPSRR